MNEWRIQSANLTSSTFDSKCWGSILSSVFLHVQISRKGSHKSRNAQKSRNDGVAGPSPGVRQCIQQMVYSRTLQRDGQGWAVWKVMRQVADDTWAQGCTRREEGQERSPGAWGKGQGIQQGGCLPLIGIKEARVGFTGPRGRRTTVGVSSRQLRA